MAKILGIIPARIGSTRIPEKMLKDIHGKPLIVRTYERTKDSKMLDELIVATDSDDIEKHLTSVGARVVRWPTPLSSRNGTEGVALALDSFNDFKPDIIVNIWGDEPLYPASAIDACVEKLLSDDNLVAVAAADRIIKPEMLEANSVVKVVTDKKDRALYISRSTIPYKYSDHDHDHYHIIGVMAMRADFLAEYVAMEQTALERIEGVEQIRILENGYELGIVKGDFNNLGVNTPDELEEVLKIYESKIKSGEID
ncbi:3-deoxy-manno-octulosonate cytidylyltransferase [Candidatus Parcubacteria bacterium]|nr:3-deoxy-manno-octulosonate cytidylyltransferase [Candidatus Parcubacteria bacterium]